MAQYSMTPFYEKPKLISVKVPWQISPSSACLRSLSSIDDESQKIPTLVTFIVNFESTADKIIELEFVTGLWAKIYTSYSEEHIFDPSKYDWSPFQTKYIKSEQTIDEFRQKWKQTGTCPDPKMYEVENSHWLKEIQNYRNNLKHYFILGNDSYIEVIASAFQWKEVEENETNVAFNQKQSITTQPIVISISYHLYLSVERLLRTDYLIDIYEVNPELSIGDEVQINNWLVEKEVGNKTETLFFDFRATVVKIQKDFHRREGLFVYIYLESSEHEKISQLEEILNQKY